jgi:hypothetical protein
MNENLAEDEHDYHFIGKAGSFCPIRDGCGGGILCREKDGKYYAATGTKGYRWLESEMVAALKKDDAIDIRYYNNLVDETVKDISEYGDFEWFISDSEDPPPKEEDNDPIGFNDTPPWCQFGADSYKTCKGCDQLCFHDDKSPFCKEERDLPF